APRQSGPHALASLARPRHSAAEALDLLLDLGRVQGARRDVAVCGVEDQGPPDGDVADASAVEQQHLLVLAEAVREQLGDRLVRRAGVVALDAKANAAAAGRGQHHQAHDALGVYRLAVELDPHLAVEFRGEIDQLRRGAGVQSELVDDFDFFFDDHWRSYGL